MCSSDLAARMAPLSTLMRQAASLRALTIRCSDTPFRTTRLAARFGSSWFRTTFSAAAYRIYRLFPHIPTPSKAHRWGRFKICVCRLRGHTAKKPSSFGTNWTGRIPTMWKSTQATANAVYAQSAVLWTTATPTLRRIWQRDRKSVV